MAWVSSILFGTTFIVMVASFWFLICNNQTHADRVAIINKVSSMDFKYWRDFERVDYNDHLWCLFFFRDPTALYSKELNWKNK